MQNKNINFSNLFTVKIVDKFTDIQVNNIDTIEDTDILCIKNNLQNLDINQINENNNIETINDNDEFENSYISIIFISDFMTPNYDSINNNLMEIITFNILVQNDNKLPTFPILEYDSNFKFKKFIRDIISKEFLFKSKDIKFIKFINKLGPFNNYLVWLNNIDNYKNNMYIPNISNEYGWRTFMSFNFISNLEKNIPIHKQICDLIYDNYKDSLNIKFRHNLGNGLFENNLYLNNILDAYKNIL
jgi:hypothetical protein